MRLKNSLYPYPVLGKERNDYVNSSFDGEINSQIEFKNLVIELDFDLNDATMKKLIAEKKAAYAAHIECSATSYRTKVQCNNSSYTFQIPVSDLRGNVEIRIFVVATERIENYTNPNFSELYDGVCVTLEKGNVLADGGGKKLTLGNDAYGYTGAESYFKVKKLKDNSKIWFDIDYSSSDYIMICLSEEMFEMYKSIARSRAKGCDIALLMAPVMQAVLSSMANENNWDNFADKNWFNGIKAKLEKNNITLEQIDEAVSGAKSAHVVAQKIFQGPLKKAMDSILSVMDDNRR